MNTASTEPSSILSRKAFGSMPQACVEKRNDEVCARSTKQKHIIHVPRRFVAEEWGGTETVVLETCRQQQLAGSNPVIFTSMALAKLPRETVQGVPVRRFGYTYPFFGLTSEQKNALDKKGGNLFSLSMLTALLREKDVRLFHAHALKRLGGTVRTAARLRKKPFVVSLHGGVFDVPDSEIKMMRKPIEGKFEWGRPLGALLGSRRVLEDADMVLCVGASECDKALVELSHDRIAHLPNGVDFARFQRGDGASFRATHGISPNTFLVLNISRIGSQKNQMLLLQAFSKLVAKKKDSHLVLIGPVTVPECAAKLRDYIEEKNLHANVSILLGMKSDNPQLIDAYHACDVFVLPSIHEPFGIVVLEAWSARKPVIVSNVGGLRRLVRADETALMIDPFSNEAGDDLNAKLTLIAENPALGARLGQAGQNEARSCYDWSRIALRQEELYQQAEENAAKRYGRAAR